MRAFFKSLIIFISLLSLVACVTNSDSGSNTGVGGSTARFVIQQNHLITIEDEYMRVLSLADPKFPELVETFEVSWGTVLETIYPYENNRLLIGTNDGAFIMDHSTPGQLTTIMIANHTTSCDPVIAHGDYMFVTLRNGRECTSVRNSEGVNQLMVFDISQLGETDAVTKEILQAELVNTIELDQPWGLSINDQSLFVCVANGVLEFDISTPSNPQQVGDYSAPCNDLIASTNPMILTSDDGIRLMQNSDPGLTELSIIRAGE